MSKFKVGDRVEFFGHEYEVLGLAASTNIHGEPLVEIAWNDKSLSPSGYYAVDPNLLRKVTE